MKRAAVLSPDFLLQAEKPLRERGFDVYAVPFCDRVDARIGGHPDLQMFAAQGRVFVHPDMQEEFIAVLSRYAEVTVCTARLGPLYPDDCPYNIAFTGRFAICRRSIIPPEIASFFERRAVPVIDVPQGYARCSTLIVDKETIITEDRGIAKSAAAAGLDVTVVRPGFVALKGFPRGFIGGCGGGSGGGSVSVSAHDRAYSSSCGLTPSCTADTDTCTDTLFLSGTLSGHPDWKTVHSKISSRNKKVVEISDSPAEDYGSIIFL